MAPVSRRKDASRWPRMSSTFWAVVLLTALLVLYCVVSLVIYGCTFCNQTPPYEIRGPITETRPTELRQLASGAKTWR
ncbi:putative protein FAM19A5-like [Scophthalmus maximus]|uniref:Uncharacterized protein n=1 Tax=Scophthalmus maximus TaxID=52904 RepID=A0A2U9B1Y0_SCOMX|nr:putative protein FAM19A5-like [Scophthalmus maximus]